MIWLRSTVFHITFCLWTLLLGVAGIPCLFSVVRSQRLAMRWVNGVLYLLHHVCHLDVQVRGLEYIATQPAVYASKHQSTLDTLVLYKLLGGPAFILKKQLLFIPIFGWYLARCKPIAIIRSLGAKMLPHMITQARARLTQGRNIVIFPEGTRTRPNAKVAYKMAGTSAIYEQTQTLLIPVALNTGLFWPKRSYTKRPGIAVIEFLPPLTAGLVREDVGRIIPERIEAATQRLLDEADGKASA